MEYSAEKFIMNKSFNDDSENDSIYLVQLLKNSSFLDKYGEYKENQLIEKKELNDNAIKEESSFLGNKTKREEPKNVKNIEINDEKIKNTIEIKSVKKQGRKKKSEIDKGFHTKNSEDNKMIKIKTFFGNNFQNFVNKILRYAELDKLGPKLNVNLKRDFNLKLWDKSLKDIYLETNISRKYSSTEPKNNIKLIKKIYEEKNDKIIKFLELSYGEVFEIFIKDINTMNLKLIKKIKDSEILDNSKFLTINDFLEKIKDQEKEKGESDEFIDKYITDIKTLCLNFKQWFLTKKGRKRIKKY